MKTYVYYILGFVIVGFAILIQKAKKTDMFKKIMTVVLRHEGGYVNDPDDLGGETKYGITRRRYPDLDIYNLTKDEAIEIYRRDFWLPLKMDGFADINLALQYFDMAVNAGPANAKKLMSEAKIEQAVHPEASLLELYKKKRKEYYTRVAEYRNNKKYLKGWLNRINSSIA